jgi:hypothetical protein
MHANSVCRRASAARTGNSRRRARAGGRQQRHLTS